MIDNSSLNDQYDFLSFGKLSLLFGHPSIIHFVTFFNLGFFTVSSLVSANLDFVTTPYVLGLSILLVVFDLSSLPGVYVTRYLRRCFLSQPDTPN